MERRECTAVGCPWGRFVQIRVSVRFLILQPNDDVVGEMKAMRSEAL
jgi:hypothetical protein